jgi:hypothetical protein
MKPKAKRLRVFAPGTLVHTGEGFRAEARVIGVAIRGRNHVSYNLAVWAGGQRHEAWVESCEVRAIPGTASRAVGFRRG